MGQKAGTAVARRRTFVSSIALLIASAPASVLAQTVPADPNAPAAAGAKPAQPGVEEIVVTAQKREEKLKDVPASVTALSGDNLQALGVQDLDHLSVYAPGLSEQRTRPGQTAIALRGITTGNSQSGTTVGVYVDDVPLGSSSSVGAPYLVSDVDTFDMQRVEIVRGPQGTLYGANTMGGVLKYITNAPDPTHWDARTEFDIGGIDGGGLDVGGKAMVNVPLVNDKLAFRATVYERSDDGFIKDIGTHNDNEGRNTVTGGRFSLLFTPTENLSIRFTSLLQDIHDDGTPIIDYDFATGKPLYGDLEQSRRLRERFSVQNQLHNLTVNWDLKWANLVSSTSYGAGQAHQMTDGSIPYAPIIQANAMVPTLPLSAFPTSTDNEKVTQEFRLASAQNHIFEWMVGAYYTYEWGDDKQSLFDTIDGVPLDPPYGTAFDGSIANRFREYAGFGNMDYYFTDDIDLGFGARWSRNRQSFRQFAEGVLNGGVTNTTGASADSAWTYSITPRWRITDELSTYGVASSGYRPGGPNVIPPAELGPAFKVPLTFGPDSLWNYEVGAKTELLDKKLTFNLAAFEVDWNAIQLTATTPSGAAYTANGGKAQSRGFEFDTTYSPISGLRLGLNGSYTRAVLLDPAPGIGGAKGDFLSTVPRWSGNLTGDYSFPAFGDWDGLVGGTLSYIGPRNSAYSESAALLNPNVRMAGYELIDLRTGVENEKWSVTLFVKNLLDRRGVTNATAALAPYGGPEYKYITQPRSVMLQVTTQF